MLFNSLHFLLFLPVVVSMYYLLPARFRWLLIFISSCYFYMSFVPKYILILFVIIIIDYTAAIAIEKASEHRKRIYLILSVTSNLLLLGFFKYFNFAWENMNGLLSLLGKNNHTLNLDIILPIGLSFHTLQSMGYTIEVYRGRQKAERHLGYFSNYVLFFPQMVAGPIERYATLGSELKKESKTLYDNFSDGFKLILFGLLVKMTIADNIAPYVNQIYAEPLKHQSAEVFAAIVLFAFQVYADFYGYSSIALGCARLLGITIIDNFKTPFSSASVTEFWRRWHISLSTWFNDYVFTPFVTSKRDWGNMAVVVGLLLTFFLSGLWHGAGWNFAIYGLMHGLALVFEFLTKKARKKLFSHLPAWFYLNAGMLLTFLYVAFSWVFFRAENMAKATDIFKALMPGQLVDCAKVDMIGPLMAVAALIGLDVFLQNSRFDYRLKEMKMPYRWAIYTVFLFCLMALSGTQKFSFIYFQF